MSNKFNDKELKYIELSVKLDKIVFSLKEWAEEINRIVPKPLYSYEDIELKDCLHDLDLMSKNLEIRANLSRENRIIDELTNGRGIENS